MHSAVESGPLVIWKTAQFWFNQLLSDIIEKTLQQCIKDESNIRENIEFIQELRTYICPYIA